MGRNESDFAKGEKFQGLMGGDGLLSFNSFGFVSFSFLFFSLLESEQKATEERPFYHFNNIS